MVGLIIKGKYLNPFEILVHNFHLTIVVVCENICFIALHKQHFLSDSSCYSMIKYSNEIENQEERAVWPCRFFLYWIGQNVLKKKMIEFWIIFLSLHRNPILFFHFSLDYFYLFYFSYLFIMIESEYNALTFCRP